MIKAVVFSVSLLLLGPGLALADAAPAPLERIDPAQVQSVEPPAGECCKTCRKGKACGDSCIAREKVCHKPPGCACDA